MRQEEINKDLGSYIHTRKDKSFWKKYTTTKIKPKFKKEEEMQSAIRHEIEHVMEEEHNLKPEDKHELESMKEQVEELDRVEQKVIEDIDEEREGILRKFFKKLNFSKEDDDEPKILHMSDNPEIVMDEDEMRELLHGLHNWIIQLPADKLEKFKTSREFELYTKYLRKHNLIK
jgi:small-conductance mechanosensitive channel